MSKQKKLFLEQYHLDTEGTIGSDWKKKVAYRTTKVIGSTTPLINSVLSTQEVQIYLDKKSWTVEIK